MSLKVWLPLKGNTTNQGVSDLSFSNVGLTSATGKVSSSCLQSSDYTSCYALSDKRINLGSNQSMFCWFKITQLMSHSNLGGALITQHRYPICSGMGLTIKYVSPTTGYLSVNTGDGTNRTFNTYCGTTLLKADEWYHGGYTYDGKTLNIYVNGNRESSYQITDMEIVEDFVAVAAWSFSSSDTSSSSVYSNYHFNGCINDVRVYDHCLSLNEIKELAKGLCVNYKLSRPKNNLLINSGIYKEIVRTWNAKDGYASYPIYANGLSTSKTYTLSCECDGNLYVHSTTGNDPINKYWTLWLYQRDTAYSNSDYSNYTTPTCFTKDNYNHKQIGNKHWWTFTPSYPNVAIRVNTYSDGTNNETVTYTNIKLEEGDTCTPWIPNQNDSMFFTSGHSNLGLPNIIGTTSSNWPAANDAWHYNTFTKTNGTNYSSSMKYHFHGEFSVTAGAPSGITLLFYNLNTNTGYNRYDVPFGNGIFDMDITSGGDCPHFLIYSGIAGSTNNIGTTVSNLRLTEYASIEPDCSGYGNDAYITTMPTYDANTPRYIGAMSAKQKSFIFNNNFNIYLQQFTMSFWARVDDIANTQHFLLGTFNNWTGNGNGIWRDKDSSQSFYYMHLLRSNAESTYGDIKWGEITIGEWNHWVLVYTGTTVATYLNGKIRTSINYGSNGSVYMPCIYIANSLFNHAPDSEIEDASLSDFRIYATALSETDIKKYITHQLLLMIMEIYIQVNL